MSRRLVIGIDNGSTGTLGIIGPDGVIFDEVPTQESLHYGRTRKGTGLRLDRLRLQFILMPYVLGDYDCQAFVERPFTGKFMTAALAGARVFEATLITLEILGIGFQTIDSGDWQKKFFNARTSAEQKKSSMLRGIEMYPQFRDQIKKHGDADGLLIAHRFFYFD